MRASHGEPASAALVAAALRAAAGIGPFFLVEVLDGAPGSNWRPAAELYERDLGRQIAFTARQLGTGERRVAASILHLDFAAKLWAPVLGCGLLRGLVPDLSALLVSAQRPFRLGLAQLAGWNASSPTRLAELTAEVVGDQLRALVAGLPVRLADGLLRGNSASAMIGALGQLSRACPVLVSDAAELARALLASGDLRGAGELADGDLVTGATPFRRRSCCLYYRVPNAGLCGDCCLTVDGR